MNTCITVTKSRPLSTQQLGGIKVMISTMDNLPKSRFALAYSRHKTRDSVNLIDVKEFQ